MKGLEIKSPWINHGSPNPKSIEATGRLAGEGRVTVEADTGMRQPPAKDRRIATNTISWGWPPEPVHTCILDFWLRHH